ncbi:MAG TPA: orotidine-5'-phosphate decarboxylase [Spirochaetes bacterium]|nr:orotidine-5'-phosphate decarboxylase [Spirochaetota bacterium]
MSKKDIPSNERLIFALDVPTVDEAKEWVNRLGDGVIFYKLGLELFMAGDYFGLMDWLIKQNKKVFADLKFFDVPETVKRSVGQLKGRGAEFLTVHGNDKILQAAVEAKGDIKILAVTALTSLDRGDLNDLGFDCDIEDLVLSRAKRALEIGCDGVISSGLEVPRLREHLGDQLIVVSPGIRPVDNQSEDDQKRVVTVDQAFRNGADYIVVGRPIKNASDPYRKAKEIQETITKLFHP